MDKFTNKKIIFVVLGAAILLEVIWATSVLLKPYFSNTKSAKVSQAARPTVVSLSSSTANLRVGERVVVSINISSDKKTDGTDLVIKYNPKLLSVVTEDKNGSPVTLGTIYRDFPLNNLDPTSGKVTVSGITDTKGGILANGLFGTIVFQTKASGKAVISLDFTLGKTTDSNVTESGAGKDLLDSVNNLNLNIAP